MDDARNDARADAAKSFRRFEDAMRKLVRVPKKEVDEKIAARREKKRAKPA